MSSSKDEGEICKDWLAMLVDVQYVALNSSRFANR